MSVYEGLIKLTEYEVSEGSYTYKMIGRIRRTLYCSDPAINKFAG